MTDSTAGIGDPYWFEWSIGQQYIVEMLRSDSGIASVTLQQTGGKGLDDVVVRYEDGRTEFIQVKHTRVEDSLTFGNLVASSPVGGPSLLRTIVDCWENESRRANGKPCVPVLLTNRALGSQAATTRGETPIHRPALTDLLSHLATSLPAATDLTNLIIRSEWLDAWTNEWLPQLAGLPDDSRRLEFLRTFRIDHRPGGLQEVTAALTDAIMSVFGVDSSGARSLLSRLDHELRRWVTTARGTAEAVTPERAYQALSVDVERPQGEHGLPPPAPFFASRSVFAETVAGTLRTRAKPIVFVSGEPGSGKTSVLSSLANRREPAIDLRFHAYRPITPENQLLPSDGGRTTEARSLWGDLLIQLRELARGRLARLRVPVLSSHLSVDDLRAHVLRIAEAIGQERGSPVAIAVDGIDHAARTGASPQSLLASLVPPEAVPPHVVFLIGGQPPEGYPTYPTWLRLPSDDVARMNVPPIAEADIEPLVAARLTNLDRPGLVAVARLIQSECSGNTLSTVFAVEEAAACNGDATQIASVLSARRLRSGVEAYYDAIWTSATQRIGLTTPAMKRLSACLCLAPMRLSPAILAAVDFHGGAPGDWTDLLRELRPLLVEEPGGFRLFHNDVRVFLERRLQADSEIYRDTASQLGDLLLSSSDPAPRHAAAQRLFGIAGRHQEQARMFTASYVLEGYAAGSTLEAIADQGLVAVSALSRLSVDWPLAHSVACGLATAERLKASIEIAENPRASRSRSAAVRVAELSVRPTAQWSLESLVATLSDIESLFDAGLHDRAEATFRRWFGSMRPDAVMGAARRPEWTSDQTVHDACERLGRLSALTGVVLPVGTDDELEAHYSRGILRAAVRFPPLRMARRLGRVRRYFLADIETTLSALVEAGHWNRVCVLLGRLVGRDLGLSVRVSAAVAAALSGQEHLRAAFVAPLLADRVRTIREVIEDRRSHDFDVIARMAELAFVFGFELREQDPSTLRGEIFSVFEGQRHDERKDELVAQALFAAALLGSIVGSSSRAQVVTARVETAAAVVNLILENERRRPHEVPFGYHQVAKRLFQGFCQHAIRTGFAFEQLRDLFQSRVDQGVDLGEYLEAVWSVLEAAGRSNALAAYAHIWIGVHGKAWNLAANRRSSLVSRLAALCRDGGHSAIADQAESRLSWATVRHFEEKDYALMRPKDWFELLSDLEPAAWRVEGLRLLAISRGATRSGGNSAASYVETALVTAAASEHPAAVRQLLGSARDLIGAEDHTVVEGLTEFVAKRRTSSDDLIAIWCFTVGQLSWCLENDRNRLCKLRDAICAAASRIGLDDFPDKMRAIAPNEFGCTPAESAAEPPPPQAPVDLADPTKTITAAIPNERFDSWSRAAHVLERLIDGAPASTATVVEIAWQALTTRRERYAWHFDSSERMYEVLVPFVSPTQRWVALQGLRGRTDADTPFVAVAVLAENMDTLCRLAAREEGVVALRDGLTRLLNMHEQWITGSGRVAAIEPIPTPTEGGPDSWANVGLGLLVELLRFGGQLRLQNALRGIFRLLKALPTAFPELARLFSGVDATLQRRILLAAESLAELPVSEPLVSSLEALVTSADRLDVALSAWTALRASRRVRSQAAPEWPSPTGDGSLIVQVAPPLMSVPGTTMGSATSAGRPANTLLRNLKIACGDDLDPLQARFVQRLASSPPDPKRPGRSRGEHDLVLPDEPEVSLLMQLARTAERAGELDASPHRLAHAVVPHADPRIFLCDPPVKTMEIPIEDALDALIRTGESATTEVLSRAIGVDLPAGARLIAGTLKTYSGKFDAIVYQDHGWPVSRAVWPIGPLPKRPAVIGGRASDAFAPNELLSDSGDRQFRWMTADVYGLMPFLDGNLDLFPTNHWRELFGWTPRNSDPLVWERNGERVAWAECYRGPQRKLYPRQLVHRQPRVFRWVCSAEEWARVTALTGPGLARKSWVTLAPIDED